MPAKVKAVLSRDPEIVRTQILDAAQAEFMAVGFASASTNRIVERFGRSKPTLFRYFPTKEALFGAVVSRIAAGWMAHVHSNDLPAELPEVWLRSFALRALDWSLQEENIFVGRMAIAEGREFPDIAETYTRLAVEPMLRVIEERLRVWTREGLLVCPHPRSAAESFLDLTIGGAVTRRLFGVQKTLSDAQARRLIDRALELFLLGTRPRSPESVRGISAATL